MRRGSRQSAEHGHKAKPPGLREGQGAQPCTEAAWAVLRAPSCHLPTEGDTNLHFHSGCLQRDFCSTIYLLASLPLVLPLFSLLSFPTYVGSLVILRHRTSQAKGTSKDHPGYCLPSSHRGENCSKEVSNFPKVTK